MLYGSKTWCLRENEVAILRRAERSIKKGNVWCKVAGQEEHREADRHVEIESSK